LKIGRKRSRRSPYKAPAPARFLCRWGVTEAATLKLHHSCDAKIASIPVWIARTGYTGELGFELYAAADQMPALWTRLMEQGRAGGLKPAGLGARDLLRLEMGYLLYGNDISEETTPLEAAVEWTVSLSKGEFIGRTALQQQKDGGLLRRLIGFELLDKGVPRHGYQILSRNHPDPIGEVTSGNLSPLLHKGIGLGYVPTGYAEPGTAILIDIRGKLLPARIVPTPFYKKPKG
jgi:aminomethyltransferase